MTEPRRCPKCEAELPADAPEGLCPKCLLEQGLETQRQPQKAGDAGAGTPPSGGFVPPSPEELAPFLPQLEIIELLGCGGMGAVYKARQPRLDRLVALKIIRPEAAKDPAFAERFAREARALALLSHPNIVAVHDFGQAGELYYFVMEYVDGASLRQAERTERLSPAQALAIVPQICDALQYAHEQGVVHRDIKPENILVDRKGRVKIADFGLAKLLGRSPADFTLTASQMVLGTPHYMAPEQVERPAEVDQRADIYSLGVVFYEMLTGELPLGRFAPPSEKVQVDVRLDEVVLKTLEKEPGRRYQHASEVKTDVEEISRGPGAAAPLEAAARQAAPPPAPPGGYAEAFFRYFMAPKPGYGKQVGIPCVVCTGLAMLGLLVSLTLEWLCGSGPGNVYERIETISEFLLIATPFVLLPFLSVVHAFRTRGGRPSVMTPAAWVMAVVIVLPFAGFGASIAVPLLLRRPHAGPEFKVTETLSKDGKVVMVDEKAIAEGKAVFATMRFPLDSLEGVLTKTGVELDKAVSSDGGGSLKVVAAPVAGNGHPPTVVRLFETGPLDIEDARLTYQARLRSEGLEGTAYLEMWCHFPGKGEFFSRGLDRPLTGTTDWTTAETPFFLRQGQRPDNVILNVVINGKGTVWIDDIRLLKGPLQ